MFVNQRPEGACFNTMKDMYQPFQSMDDLIVGAIIVVKELLGRDNSRAPRDTRLSHSSNELTRRDCICPHQMLTLPLMSSILLIATKATPRLARNTNAPEGIRLTGF